METLNVEVTWCDKNFAGGCAIAGVGAIVATGKTLDSFKKEFESALEFHIESMVNDNEEVPQWLLNHDYQIIFNLKTSALLREAERYTSMAVISRETGINQKQLSHYASNLKEPREPQRRKILAGLNKIAQSFMALC